MYNRILILTAVILAAIFLPSAGANAQPNVPIVQADTVFQGFPTGIVTDVAVTNEGNSLILMHNTTPTEIDIKTHTVLREFQSVPNAAAEGNTFMFIDKQKNYLGSYQYSTKYLDGKKFNGNVIWDLTTGQIIKAIPNVLLLTEGIHYYTYIKKDNKVYLGRYDMNLFKMLDSINLPLDLPGDGHTEWTGLGIIPNSNKVLLGVNRYDEFTPGEKEYLLSELYVLDFDTKKFTKIPIPYESGQKRSEIIDITVSQNGLNNIITLSIPGPDAYYYIYDQNLNFKEKVKQSSIIYNNLSIGYGLIQKFIDDQYFVSYFSQQGSESTFMVIFDILNREIKGICPFYSHQNVDSYNNIIAISQYNGLTGIIDISPISVNDLPKELTSNINYSNNQLEYDSDKAFLGQSTIYDTTGKLITNLGFQSFTQGKNIIKLNHPLSIGMYLLTIKNDIEQKSYKFIVE